MTKIELTEMFNELLNRNNIDPLPKKHMLALDETIESIIDGGDTINGRKPNTTDEYACILLYGLNCRTQMLEDIAMKVMELGENTTIQINYRGEKFIYSN